MSDLHYIFENDKVYAIREGKVIAEAATLGELEKVAWGDPGYGEERAYADGAGEPGQYVCPNCGQDTDDYGSGRCAHCGERLQDNYDHPANQDRGHAYDDPYEDTRDLPSDYSGEYYDRPDIQSSVVVGPGGLKGKVLGKVKGLWADEVAVRFENGRIAHLRVLKDGSIQGGFKESFEKQASSKTSAADELRARLEADFDTGRAGITARMSEVESIVDAGRKAIASASAADAAVLDSIILTAEVERGTLRQALDAIEADEAAQAEFAPYEMQAAPAQESLGRGEGNWLDGVVSSMIAEAEGQDFEKITKEEPLTFVADLPDVAVADTGDTRARASSYIRSKTAGLAQDQAEGIARAFLANVEEARKRELASRKQTTHKEAASREDKYKDLPDDILFA